MTYSGRHIQAFGLLPGMVIDSRTVDDDDRPEHEGVAIVTRVERDSDTEMVLVELTGPLGDAPDSFGYNDLVFVTGTSFDLSPDTIEWLQTLDPFETDHAYTQHEREVMLAAWLDITAERFREVVLTLDDEVMNRMNDEPIVQYIVQICKPDDEVDQQLMFQALCQTSDKDLHGFVTAFHPNGNPIPEVSI